MSEFIIEATHAANSTNSSILIADSEERLTCVPREMDRLREVRRHCTTTKSNPLTVAEPKALIALPEISPGPGTVLEVVNVYVVVPIVPELEESVRKEAKE
jgi:hypothetical protein